MKKNRAAGKKSQFWRLGFKVYSKYENSLLNIVLDECLISMIILGGVLILLSLLSLDPGFIRECLFSAVS